MPTYPICHAVMNSHLEVLRGHPDGNVDAQGYLQWLTRKINPSGSENSIDAVRKWFRGDSRPYNNKLPRLYHAFGLKPGDPLQRHLMWELQICTASPQVNVNWYSAEIDAARLSLLQNHSAFVAQYVGSLPQAAQRAGAAPADDTAPTCVAEPPSQPQAPAAPKAQQALSEKLLLDAHATELLHALYKWLDPNRRPATVSDVRLLIDDLRARCQGHSKAAMQAVVGAVKDLHVRGTPLSRAALEHTCRTATQLFVLFLAEFAAQPARDRSGRRVEGKLAFAQTDNPLAAAVLAECHHLAGELRFVYLGGGRVDLQHYLRADDPGISPGFGLQACKADLEARIARELSGGPMPPHEVPLTRPSWTDAKLAGLVENMADFRGVHFRFLVDLSAQAGSARLSIARELNRDIGLAVVAYGDDAEPLPDLVHCGSLRPGSGDVDSLLVMLLDELHVLHSRQS
jgi:hypothetical protein